MPPCGLLMRNGAVDAAGLMTLKDGSVSRLL
jgi:hypothetical protein